MTARKVLTIPMRSTSGGNKHGHASACNREPKRHATHQVPVVPRFSTRALFRVVCIVLESLRQLGYMGPPKKRLQSLTKLKTDHASPLGLAMSIILLALTSTGFESFCYLS